MSRVGVRRQKALLRMAASGLLCALIATPAGAAKHKRLPTEPLEKEEDAPMFIFRNGVSPGMVSQYGEFTSHQVNVDAEGHNITGDAANEPSLAVDPMDHSRMTIGWRQFNSVASNFRQAGWGYTTTGGTSWTFPGVLQNNVFRSDPVLDSDDTGNFFYLSLLNSFYDTMWQSLNGGASWANVAPADGGDKEWFTIDKSNSVGHGFQYQSWSIAGNNYNGRQFTRSTDGGATWLNPVNIPNSPAWGTLDTDSAGNLFIGGVNLNDGNIWCEHSSNAKYAGVTPTFDRSTPINIGGEIGSSAPINPDGLVGQIYLKVDRSGTSTNNNVYMLASVIPTGFDTGSEVMFIRSTNGGQTFSAPIQVNDDPFNPAKWHWFGTLSVAPNGRLDAVWLDSRYAANNTDSQLFYSYSTNAGATWAANVPVSRLFDPFLGYPDQDKIGDYISIVSDNSGADVAYSATFNGEEDIYYARVAPLLSRLQNISTRARALTGNQVLIAGFIITGNAPKQVIIRGLGPSLTNVGVALANPTLELHRGTTLLATNDNWKVKPDGQSQEAAIEATRLAPMNDYESAILDTLNPGAYTAILSGKNGGTGVGLVEVYDLSAGANAKLGNISTRGFVGTGNNVMIGGFIVGAGGGGGSRVAARALGPSLAGVGIADALADPTLALYDANGTVLATNDNWQTNAQSGQSQEAEVDATGLAPTSPLESVIVTSLAPGAYTVIVSGKNNATGVGLVETYDLP